RRLAERGARRLPVAVDREGDLVLLVARHEEVGAVLRRPRGVPPRHEDRRTENLREAGEAVLGLRAGRPRVVGLPRGRRRRERRKRRQHDNDHQTRLDVSHETTLLQTPERDDRTDRQHRVESGPMPMTDMRRAAITIVAALVALAPALDAGQAGGPSVQYRSPDGVEYRSLPDTDAVKS